MRTTVVGVAALEVLAWVALSDQIPLIMLQPVDDSSFLPGFSFYRRQFLRSFGFLVSKVLSTHLKPTKSNVTAENTIFLNALRCCLDRA